MSDESESEEKKIPSSADYASESRLSGDYTPPPPAPVKVAAISSSPLEIGKILRESIPPPESAGTSSSSASIPPPSTIVENAMERGHRMPLSKMLGIGAAVFVVLVGLTLLLFR